MSGVRYTPAERRRRAVLLAKGARKAFAGASTAAIDRQLDRIEQAAADRWRRDAEAALRLLERCKDELAAARARERAASRADKARARQERKAAEAALRRAERAAAKYLPDRL